MLAPTPMTIAPERWRKLGWSAFSRLVIAAATAVGTKIGERVIDALLGDDERDDDEETEQA